MACYLPKEAWEELSPEEREATERKVSPGAPFRPAVE